MINCPFNFNRFFWTSEPTIFNWLPRLQSHRGYWVNGIQQNSLLSIQESYNLNFNMVEFDVRLTRDKKVILFHDDKILNRYVADLNYHEMSKNLPFNSNGQYFEKIDLLEDLLQWYIDNKIYLKMKLNIEIKSKNIFNSDLEYFVFKLIEKFKIEKYVLISSFNPFSLFRFKKYNSRIYRAILLTFSPESNWILNSLILNLICRPHALHLHHENLNYFVGKVNKLPIPIIIWVINEEIHYFNLLNSNIHGIITDKILVSKSH